MKSKIEDLPALWKNGFRMSKIASQFSNAPCISKKMGAALFNGNKLLSIGHNKYGHTHPKYSACYNNHQKDFDRCVHAEQIAMVKRRYYNNDNNLILYIYREHADGSLGNSCPCNICMELIKIAGVKKIRYIQNGFFIEKIIR